MGNLYEIEKKKFALLRRLGKSGTNTIATCHNDITMHEKPPSDEIWIGSIQ